MSTWSVLLLVVCFISIDQNGYIFKHLVSSCGSIGLYEPIKKIILPVTKTHIGQNISIPCHMPLENENDTLGVAWLLNGAALPATHGKFEMGGHSLKIVGFSEANFGSYQCVVTTVNGRLLGLPVSLKYDLLSSPKVTLRTPSLVTTGNPIVLNCTFAYESSFRASVTWFKNGAKIPPVGCQEYSETSYIMCRDGASSTLYIWNSTLGDSGSYSCTARINMSKKKSNPVAIQVSDQDTSITTTTATPDAFLSTLTPPETRTMHIAKASRDHRYKYLNVPCGLQITDLLPLDWEVNKVGNSNARLKYISRKNHMISLKLYNLAAGAYNLTCSYSTNSSSAFHTTLIYLHQEPSTCLYNDYNRLALEGSTLSLSPLSNCDGHTFFPSDNIWYFNGERVPLNWAHGSISPNGHQLTIRNMSESISGYYQKYTRTPVGEMLMNYRVVLRKPLQIFPEVTVYAKHVVKESVICEIELNLNMTEMPICGIATCGALEHETGIFRQAGFAVNYYDKNQSVRHVLTTHRFLPMYTNFTLIGGFTVIIGQSQSRLSVNSSNTIQIETPESRPDNCPCFFVSKETPTSLTVKWWPIAKLFRNGVIIHHQVFWRQSYAGAPTHRVNLDSDVYTFEIRNLIPGMYYNVGVRSATRIGFPLACTIREKQAQTTLPKSMSTPFFTGSSLLLLSRSVPDWLLQWTVDPRFEERAQSFVLTTWFQGNYSQTTMPADARYYNLTLPVSMVRIDALDASNNIVSRQIIEPNFHPPLLTGSVSVSQECYADGSEVLARWNYPLNTQPTCDACYFTIEASLNKADETISKLVDPDIDPTTWKRQQVWFTGERAKDAYTTRMKCLTIYGVPITSNESISCNSGSDPSASLPPPNRVCYRLDNDTVQCNFSLPEGTVSAYGFALRFGGEKGFVLRATLEYPYVQLDVSLSQEAEFKVQTALCRSEVFCSKWSTEEPVMSGVAAGASMSRLQTITASSIGIVIATILIICGVIAFWVAPKLITSYNRQVRLTYASVNTIQN